MNAVGELLIERVQHRNVERIVIQLNRFEQVRYIFSVKLFQTFEDRKKSLVSF